MWKEKRSKLYSTGIMVLLFLLGIAIGICLSGRAAREEVPESDTGSKEFVTPEIQDNLEQLERIVNYAISCYCNEKGIENQYTFQLLEDLLHFNTRIYDVTDKYIFDLDKRIAPALTNHRYLFQIEGIPAIYVEVNTYRMKLYVYEQEQIERGRMIEGEYGDPLLDGMELEECVTCDWPDDMWDEEYSSFLDGWEYLKTPDWNQMVSENPYVYGMVIYSLKRYCEENGIQEVFHFEYPKDRVSNVTLRMMTVMVKSEYRMLYMDVDLNGNKVHIYEVNGSI